MSDINDTNQGFFLKIESIRKRSHASSLLLKQDDIIIAINNEIFTSGEKQLIEVLNDFQKDGKDILLTFSRNNILFDLLVSRSLGCKFTTLNKEETAIQKDLFSKKEIHDISNLQSYTILRDLNNQYDFVEKSYSPLAGIFPPAWLAYEQKWWLLSFFCILSILLYSVNIWFFMLGWMFGSVYFYKAQINLLLSFSMLTGKAFSMKLAATNIHEAQKLVREINPKAKFKYSKLEKPIDIDNDEKKNNENKNNVTETSDALV